MYLQYNENKFNIKDLISYDNHSLIVKLASYPLGLEEDNNTAIELFADDGKRLRSFC